MKFRVKEKVYIAGKIKGLNYSEVVVKFSKAENLLKREGYEVVNPISVIQQVNDVRFVCKMDQLADELPEHRREIFKHCISHLAHCDVIYLLEDYKDSPGAFLEKDIAEKMGLKVLHQNKKYER